MFAALALIQALGQQAPPTTIAEMWEAWCARCHAQDGSGKLAEPTISVEPMDFTDCKVTSPEPDADWELAVSHGGPAVGLSSEMPAFGDTLTPEQIRGFVAHLRTFCREEGWPSGNMNFPRPIFTEKAFPENELVLLPFISHRQPESLTNFDLLAIYERRFGKRSMWEVSVPIASHDTFGTARRQGVGDIEVAVKHVLATDDRAMRIVSGGVEVVLPTGSEARGLGHGTTIFEPFVAAGAVIGGSYVQAHVKVELPVDRAKADRAAVYNIYVGRDSSISPRTWTLGIELNGENTELALTPQVRKGLTGTGALGAAVGVQIPLNERAGRSTRIVGYLLWEYLEPVRAKP